MNGELEIDVGKLLAGGFEGQAVDGEFVRLAQAGRVCGAILFRRNLGGLPEVRNLTDELHGLGLFVAVDQEGGRVQRLRNPFPELPPMRELGAAGRESIARLAGQVLGAGLRVMGFDQNYAPVFDVDSNPANPVIGDRAFSRDSDVVSRLGVAFVTGHQEMGVAACAKHFPGHGDTDLDSHRDLPRVEHSLERLKKKELPPFRAAAQAGVAAVMTAHVVYANLDPDRPATLSKRVLEPLLRADIGFDGVVVSDDLEMEAIARDHGIEEAAIAALEAGCDQLLICRHPELIERAHASIVRAVVDGRLSKARVERSAQRVRALEAKYRRSSPAPRCLEDALPHALHRELLAQLDSKNLCQGRDPTEPEDA